VQVLNNLVQQLLLQGINLKMNLRLGKMLVDDMRNAFDIESVQSPLSLAYQYAFNGNMFEARSDLQIASSELDSLAINLTRAGQQIAAMSENRSLTADNSTRQMMAGLGVAFTQLGVSANELKQNLPTDSCMF
jgi:hypothetical protein